MIKTVRRLARGRQGFTLIELLVVILIIGILVSIALPQYFKVVEKGKASEAFAYLDAVKGAQERLLLKTGSYYSGALDPSPTAFDTTLPTLKYFTAGSCTTASVGTTPTYACTVTRGTGSSPAPSSYGSYVLTYDSGANPALTCTGGSDAAACTTDLLP
ncbi:MAG: prepilin-type N-terminal cleavage/methylation domain-containing protein [Elusimicrobia bacterium]|nr:prepilin-type N-terminal cleavage/methylation domain-containing protein [Elusimicrobiota bacterium]MDE2236922.1 prepilin-type N-terminal cleavage/methylation domain-containing protein [Elusimicrobiota bacterium]MDE2424869.1 prepilin-type N-terminal cleavage/methylation domain-containing protein [Elusimicrobiota bacterium]